MIQTIRHKQGIQIENLEFRIKIDCTFSGINLNMVLKYSSTNNLFQPKNILLRLI